MFIPIYKKVNIYLHIYIQDNVVVVYYSVCYIYVCTKYMYDILIYVGMLLFRELN